MPKQDPGSYYPGSQNLFQDLHSNSSHPFIIGFIQLGKEAHTSSMVQSLSFSFLHRSLSSFTRFLGQNVWAMEEVAETTLEQFFHTLRIKAHSVVFLIVDDTIIQKSGKRIPQDVPGIAIMLRRPMSLATNGSSRPKNPFNLLPQISHHPNATFGQPNKDAPP